MDGMDIEFWLSRWQEDQIGFHQAEINPYLQHYFGHLGPPAERRGDLRVFVPLCGKSQDLLWLAQQGYAVVGVECSEVAVAAFFAEYELDPIVEHRSALVHYQSAQLELYLGDFFTMTAQQCRAVTDVFDRAALIALPADMRVRYVSTLREILPIDARIMLVTLTYPQQQMDGPPFSLSEEEVSTLYGSGYHIEKLCQTEILNQEPGFKAKGLDSLVETVYKMVPR